MNIKEKFYPNLWIGLANVSDESTLVLGAKNAYVNVVGLAENPSAFRKLIKASFEKMNIRLRRLEEVEILSERILNFEVDVEILSLAEELLKNNEQVKYATFYTYD